MLDSGAMERINAFVAIDRFQVEIVRCIFRVEVLRKRAPIVAKISEGERGRGNPISTQHQARRSAESRGVARGRELLLVADRKRE